MDSKKRTYDLPTALQKARAWCAYQERCQREARDKLYDLGLYPHDVESAIATLINEGFINEQRFACTFAGGKFRIKKWGRNKILHELRQRDISEVCIRNAMKEIDEADYIRCIEEMMQEKIRSLRTTTPRERIAKTIRFLAMRGFETDLIYDVANRIKPINK